MREARSLRTLGVLLFFREAGRDESLSEPPARSLLVSPRLSADARCFLSEELATSTGVWNFAQKRGPGGGEEEGRRPAARNGIRSPKQCGGEDRSGSGGSGGSEGSALRCPPAVHQRGRPDVPGMVNTGHYALVNRLRAAQRLV